VGTMLLNVTDDMKGTTDAF